MITKSRVHILICCTNCQWKISKYLNRGGLAEILCKPKILPLKSAVLEQLQKIEKEIEGKEEEEELNDANGRK
jgi:hypothetical protein